MKNTQSSDMESTQPTNGVHFDSARSPSVPSGAQVRNRPSAPSRFAFLRAGAYLLFFVSGAAAMYAVNAVKSRELVERPLSKDAQHLPPPVLSATDTPPEQPGTPVDSGATLIPTTPPPASESPASAESTVATSPDANELTLIGVTEPAPGKFAKLPLATGQAVAFVDVKVGDRIKKGWQCFSHWESPERLQAMKSDLEKERKLLDVAKARSSAAVQTIERLKKLKGTLSAQELQNAETDVAVRRAELEAAQAAINQSESQFAAMEFEFNQAFVTSPIEGIVVSVDVIPGERRQLSGPFRGVTVMDPRVLHCRCMLNQDQLAKLLRMSRNAAAAGESESYHDRLKNAVQADVDFDGQKFAATVAWIGLQADTNGSIPLVLEVPNPEEQLRSGIRVNAVLKPRS